MKSKSKGAAVAKPIKKAKFDTFKYNLAGVKTSVTKKQAVWLMMIVGSAGYYYTREPATACRYMLKNGHWTNFWKAENISLEDVEMLPNGDSSLRLPNGDWAYNGTFIPDTCNLHYYEPEEIRECFSPNGQNASDTILVIGDSRARLMWRVLNARYHGENGIEDVKIHDDLVNYPFLYYWSESFNGEPIVNQKDTKNELTAFEEKRSNLFEDMKTAQYIIIDEHFMHPATDMLNNAASRTFPAIEKYLTENVNHLRDFIIPKVLGIAKRDATILVIASEGSRRIYPGWSQKKWDRLRDFYNKQVEKVCDNYSRVHYLYNNVRTMYGPHKENLLADGTHKVITHSFQGFQKIPDSLLADTEMIFNLHCNRKLGRRKTDEQTCCTRG